MIGGVDIIVSGPPTSGLAHAIIRQLRKEWPDAIVRDDDDREVLRTDEIVESRLDPLKEFFVYRTPDVARIMSTWMNDGYLAHGDGMIHVIIGPTSTTIVGDHNGSPDHRRRLSEVVRAILDLRASKRAPTSST